MWAIYKSSFKNILLYMNGRLSKIRSLHTYVMHQMFYFERYCILDRKQDPYFRSVITADLLGYEYGVEIKSLHGYRTMNHDGMIVILGRVRVPSSDPNLVKIGFYLDPIIKLAKVVILQKDRFKVRVL